MRSGGRTVLIILYPQYSHALYLDSSKNINKKDYTHIKYVLDSAIFYYGKGGGEVNDKKTRHGRPAFGHKTDFCCISSNRVILLMMDSMSYTTCWSTDVITRTFACHLHPAMPIFCNVQRT